MDKEIIAALRSISEMLIGQQMAISAVTEALLETVLRADKLQIAEFEQHLIQSASLKTASLSGDAQEAFFQAISGFEKLIDELADRG